MNISEILAMLENGRLTEASLLLDTYDKVKDIAYWEVASKVYFRQQNWGKTINACLKVLEINPNKTEARGMLEIAKGIIGFSNREIFNP